MPSPWVDRVHALAGIDQASRALATTVPTRRLKRGTVIFRAGDEARSFFIVLAGRISVTITGPTGREILLYEVGDGETCAFRAFVFGSFGRRLTDVIHLLEKVAFVPIESRLAAMLLDRAGSALRIDATHQDLASAIGSAREVVSRRLDALRDRGIVDLGRGFVTIRDRPALAAIATGVGDHVTDSTRA